MTEAYQQLNIEDIDQLKKSNLVVFQLKKLNDFRPRFYDTNWNVVNKLRLNPVWPHK